MYRDMKKKKKKRKEKCFAPRSNNWLEPKVILLIEPVVENCTVIFIIGYSHR